MLKTYVRRLLAGAAGTAIGVAGAVALSLPAQATETQSSVEFENDCDGTWVTVQSGTDLDSYEWVIAETSADGGAYLEELEPGESATVFAQKWENLSVDFEGSPDEGWPQEWTWEAPEHCPPPGDQLPENLGEWTFDCEVAEITFLNPFDETEDFEFLPSTGESQMVEIEEGGDATVEFPSSEGLVVEIRLVSAGGRLVTEPLEIRSELWDDLGCEEAAEEDTEGSAGEAEELPLTGAATGLLALGAVALLMVGGGLFLFARRRRITFSA